MFIKLIIAVLLSYLVVGIQASRDWDDRPSRKMHTIPEKPVCWKQSRIDEAVRKMRFCDKNIETIVPISVKRFTESLNSSAGEHHWIFKMRVIHKNGTDNSYAHYWEYAYEMIPQRVRGVRLNLAEVDEMRQFKKGEYCDLNKRPPKPYPTIPKRPHNTE